jgi:hypothetical protein
MVEIDRFRPAEDDSPAQDGYAITLSDSQNEQQPFRALYVGVSGDVVVFSIRERSTLYKNVPAGTVLPVAGKRVNLTGTTATFLVGLV